MQHVSLKLRGIEQIVAAEVTNEMDVTIDEIDYTLDQLPVDIPPVKTVYGTLLNFQGAYEALEPKMTEEPYNIPPKAPVLYIKPKNTYIGYGRAIPLPEGVEKLEVGATLGVVIGKTATKVKEEEALNYVLGYTVVNDVSIPHESVLRPAIKEKARDGFCPIGPWIVDKSSVANPNDVIISVFINGEKKQENTTKNLRRSLEKLLHEVTDFMTLHQGDVLLVGVPENAPLAEENDLVRIEIAGVGVLENRIVPENSVIGGDMR